MYPTHVFAQALVNKAILSGAGEKTVDDYDEVVRLFGTSSRRNLRDQARKSLVNKARILMQMTRYDRAIEALDAVVDEPVLRDDIYLWALYWKIEALKLQGRDDDVPAACDKFVVLVQATTRLELKEAAAKALLSKASILRSKGDWSGELTTYNVLFSKFGTDVDRDLAASVGEGEAHRIELLAAHERYSEAESTCDDLIRRCDNYGWTPLGAWARLQKAYSLADQENLEDAIKVCSSIVEAYGPDSSTPHPEFVARALQLRINLLCDLSRDDDALRDCETLLKKHGATDSLGDLWALEAVARAFLFKGQILQWSKKNDEAINVLNELIAKFFDRTESSLCEYVASARELLK
jgi:tetratricopeptide (TPR) repeat protein